MYNDLIEKLEILKKAIEPDFSEEYQDILGTAIDVIRNTKKNYNKEFLAGFDWCCEMAVDNFFDNGMGPNICSDCEDTYIGHILSQEMPENMQDAYDIEFTFGDRKPEKRTVETYEDFIRAELIEWIISCRHQLEESIEEDEWLDGQGEEGN